MPVADVKSSHRVADAGRTGGALLRAAVLLLWAAVCIVLWLWPYRNKALQLLGLAS